MISIIVPVYNSEEFLEKCITSIMDQTYKDLEIILINDCSTDNSFGLCKEFSKKDIRIKVLNNEKNEGQAYSYLKALKISKGEFIGFVDSDDWIDETMFEKLYKALRESEADMAICGCYKVYPSRRIKEPENVEKITKKLFTKEDLKNEWNHLYKKPTYINDLFKMYRCNKLIKKEILLNNLIYVNTNIKVFEDNNLMLPSIIDCNKIIYINQCLYYYRQHEKSTMNKLDKSIIYSNYIFIEQQKKIFRDKNIPCDISPIVLLCCVTTVGLLLNCSMTNKEKKELLNVIRKDLIKYDVKLTRYFKSLYSKKVIVGLIIIKFHMFNLFYLVTLLYFLQNRREI